MNLHPASAALRAALALEPAGGDVFVGPRLERNLPRVFGGLVLGQALLAAARTVPDDFLPHSLHAYFLRGGDSRETIDYQVESMHDGRSFRARNVRAWQGERLLYQMSASFHLEQGGLEHGNGVDLPGDPDDATPLEDWCRDSLVPLADWWTTEGPFEIRFVHRPVGLVGGEPAPARQTMWIRPRAAGLTDPVTSAAFLAFASDLHLLGVSLIPHGRAWTGPRGVTGASIDHAMWFHRPFIWSDWLACRAVSPIAYGARAFIRCTFEDAAGVLLASAAQEGLLRT